MMHALFSSKERGFWVARIEAAAGDSKKCWRTMNKLMCKDSKCKIPDTATAEVFSRFFVELKLKHPNSTQFQPGLLRSVL